MFSASGITTAPATSRGLRIGLFDFSEPGSARVTADGFSTGTGAGSPGTNVTGYMLNLNFAQAFTINNPIEIMKRTDTTAINLMGASTNFTRVGTTGGGVSGTPGFSNDVAYTLVFAAQLMVDSVDLTVTISNTNGWSISHTVTDSTSPVMRFDSLAIRPNSVLDSAETFIFKQHKAELIPFHPRLTGVALNPDQLTVAITWESLPGKSYELEWAQAVNAATWNVVGTTTSAGRSASLIDRNGYFEDQRFYRVRQLP